MATYKEIKGVTVQTRDEDPVVFAGTWASGGNINTGRAYGGSAGENNESAMYFGGYTISPASNYAITEQYNGTAWTEVGDLSNARTGLTGSFGTYTAAVAVGGDEFPPSSNTRYLTDVEEWGGSSWTSGTAIPTAIQNGDGAGTLTAGITMGGNVSGNAGIAESFEYDGTNWTDGGDMNTTRNFAKLGCGTQTASLICGGGDVPGYTANTELYNGSSWTEVNNVNNADAQAGGGGTQTSAITARGQASSTTQSESWDGTSWTITANTSTDSYAIGGTGASSKDAIIYAGYDSNPPSFPTSTEEFSFPPDTAVALNEGDLFLSGGTTLKGFGKAAGIPAGVFASGGSLNTARRDSAGFGLTQNAALIATGNDSPQTVNVETYNGTSFTEVNNVNASRNFVTGGGTQTAGMIYGGSESPSPARTAIVEEWDGTSWTEIADVNTGRYGGAGSKSGSPTNQLFFCGNRAPNNNSGYTESWNGTAWTELSDANTNRRLTGGVGSGSTDALVFGGDSNPSPYTANTESWDGSAWTEVNNLNAAKRFTGGSAGNTTSALCMGGEENPGDTANNEFWNGTSWTELNNLSAVTAHNAGAGSSALAISMGRGTGSTDTEEFTADATLSTVTVS
jgi:hypothetical protein